jgi:hypothetical protein
MRRIIRSRLSRDFFYHSTLFQLCLAVASAGGGSRRARDLGRGPWAALTRAGPNAPDVVEELATDSSGPRVTLAFVRLALAKEHGSAVASFLTHSSCSREYPTSCESSLVSSASPSPEHLTRLFSSIQSRSCPSPLLAAFVLVDGTVCLARTRALASSWPTNRRASALSLRFFQTSFLLSARCTLHIESRMRFGAGFTTSVKRRLLICWRKDTHDRRTKCPYIADIFGSRVASYGNNRATRKLI